MRMRLKKHLDERILHVNGILLAREGDDFYKLTDEEKNFVKTVSEIFGNGNDLYLELGCGKGAFAIASATQHPERNYIAVEKLSNVIVVACENAVKANLPNLRFINCRAENMLCYLPEHSVKQIILNFSCPFPKKTYANRRLTSKNYLELYKRLLAEDGIISQKTDNLDFFEWSIESFAQNGFETFDVTYDLPADAPDNVVTEYEAKFRMQYQKIYALRARVAR